MSEDFNKKKCYACYQLKDEEEFPLIREKRKGYCTECYKKIVGKTPEECAESQRAAIKRHNETSRETRRKVVEEILDKTPCQDCGIINPIVMDFDHREPSDKSKNISTLIQQGTIKSLKEELAKCDVVCANCHRIRTAKMFGNWRSRI